MQVWLCCGQSDNRAYLQRAICKSNMCTKKKREQTKKTTPTPQTTATTTITTITTAATTATTNGLHTLRLMSWWTLQELMLGCTPIFSMNIWQVLSWMKHHNFKINIVKQLSHDVCIEMQRSNLPMLANRTVYRTAQEPNRNRRNRFSGIKTGTGIVPSC